MKNILLITIQLLIIIIVSFTKLVANDINTEGIVKKYEVDKPKLLFDEQSYDFGRIYIGESISHTFKLKNTGIGILVIENVKTSCGCTAALVSKNKLQKDEEGEIEVKFNAGKYVGKVTKSITINSNDSEKPKYKLTITGEVIEEVSVNPKRLNLGIIRRGDALSKNIEIRTVPELNIEVKKVESPNPYVSVSKAENTGKHIYNYKVTIGNYEYIGKVNGIIFIYTTSGKQERVDLPFSAEFVGDITYYPEALSFGNVRRNQDIKRTIIVNFINKDIKIEKIEFEPANFNYLISELSSAGNKVIDVKLNNHNAIGKINGNLKIYTNSVIQPIINIPISGEIKG